MAILKSIRQLFGAKSKEDIAIDAEKTRMAAVENFQPVIDVRIPGFAMTYAVENNVTGGTFYDVTIQSDGTNKEYPEVKEYNACVAISGSVDDYQFREGTSYFPLGYKLSRLTLVEDFFNAHWSREGGVPPSHHHVGLRIDLRNVMGEKESFSMGYAIRQSDRAAIARRSAP